MKSHDVSVVSLIIGFVIMSLAYSPISALGADPKDELEEKGITFDDKSFFKSAKKGELETVKLFLAASMDVNAKNKYGQTVLHLASRKGHTDIVKLLLVKGAEVNAKNKKGETPLINVSSKAHPEILILLLENGADVNAKSKKGDTALIEAAYSGQTKTAKVLIGKGADIDAKAKNGRTALYYATYKGRTDIVKLLLKKGADQNVKDNKGKTPLVLAQETRIKNKADIVKLLESWGAATTAADGTVKKQGEKLPTLNADNFVDSARKGDLGVVKRLINAGMNVNAKDKMGRSALKLAAEEGHAKIVEYLVKVGADRYQLDVALLAVANEGDPMIFKFLLEHGANVNARDHHGFTPLDYAERSYRGVSHPEPLQMKQEIINLLKDAGAKKCGNICDELRGRDIPYSWNSFLKSAANGDMEAVKLLLDAGMNVDTINLEGTTALIASARSNEKGRKFIETVKLLLEKGANVNASDAYGTPLMSAAYSGNVEMVRLLLDNGANVNAKDGNGKTALDKAKMRNHGGVVALLQNGVRTGKSPNSVGQETKVNPASEESLKIFVEKWKRLKHSDSMQNNLEALQIKPGENRFFISRDMYQLFLADANNDGKKEQILVVHGGSLRYGSIYEVYSEEGGELKPLHFDEMAGRFDERFGKYYQFSHITEAGDTTYLYFVGMKSLKLRWEAGFGLAEAAMGTTTSVASSPRDELKKKGITFNAVHPLVDISTRMLLGGSNGGLWIPAKKAVPMLKDEINYQLYSARKLIGETKGKNPYSFGRHCEETYGVGFSSDPFLAGDVVVAAAVDWPLLPRAPKFTSTKQKVYIQEAARLLENLGLQKPEVNLESVIRIDLDGDGTEEVVVSAAHEVLPENAPSNLGSYNYSLIFLRRIVGGKVETVPLLSHVYKDDVEGNPGQEYYLSSIRIELVGIFDLNGDGKMELLVYDSDYEGSSVIVYEVDGLKVKKVLEAGCGL